jgi:hypothetical protein
LRFLIAFPNENSARVPDIAGSASAQQHQNKTHFNDYEVSKASNSVISTDGRSHFKVQGPPTPLA